jgi:hypothetical protein
MVSSGLLRRENLKSYLGFVCCLLHGCFLLGLVFCSEEEEEEEEKKKRNWKKKKRRRDSFLKFRSTFKGLWLHSVMF